MMLRFLKVCWLGLLPVAGVLLSGCTGIFQDYKENINDFVTKPDPLKVVKKTPSGDRRAKFLRQIQEPARHGGNTKEQDEVVNLLVKTATSDSFPTCRLAAISALGRFKDPRAARGLQDAYYQADDFAPYLSNMIKQHALTALGKTESKEGKLLLIQVAQAGAKERNPGEQTMTNDQRLAAIRALANYKDPEVAKTLVHIMRNERDVAMRERTNQTFKAITGKRLPEDPQALDKMLQSGNIATVSDRSSNPILRLISWPWW